MIIKILLFDIFSFFLGKKDIVNPEQNVINIIYNEKIILGNIFDSNKEFDETSNKEKHKIHMLNPKLNIVKIIDTISELLK